MWTQKFWNVPGLVVQHQYFCIFQERATKLMKGLRRAAKGGGVQKGHRALEQASKGSGWLVIPRSLQMMSYFVTHFTGGLGSAGLTGVKILEIFFNYNDSIILWLLKTAKLSVFTVYFTVINVRLFSFFFSQLYHPSPF